MAASFETSPLRVVLGLLSGAIVGGAVFWAGALIVDPGPIAQSMELAQFLSLSVATGVIWLAGLLVLACPFWLILHRLKNRGPLSAIALGAGLSFLFFFGAVTNWFGLNAPGVPIGAASLLSMDWRRGLEAAGWMTPLGALVGLVVWRVAYRRVATALIRAQQKQRPGSLRASQPLVTDAHCNGVRLSCLSCFLPENRFALFRKHF